MRPTLKDTPSCAKCCDLITRVKKTDVQRKQLFDQRNETDFRAKNLEDGIEIVAFAQIEKHTREALSP